MMKELTRFGYNKPKGGYGEYVGVVAERTETTMLVELHEVFDTLKDGTKKQAYRTLVIERTTVIEKMTITVG